LKRKAEEEIKKVQMQKEKDEKNQIALQEASS
jgi:hypothetical protein